MKQVLQNLGDGRAELAEVPAPKVRQGHLLIKTVASLVSSGTERSVVELGQASLFQKARRQPEKVLQVLEKIKKEGLFQTIDAVREKLDHPIIMGYSNVGIVVEKGTGVNAFKVGDRVVSNGPHADIVLVPKNLCAKIPETVSDEDAAFTVLGAIGLQGIRLANPTLGENFVVTGLGLIGLISAQILKANGCRVLGVDLDPGKIAMAESLNIQAINLSSGEDLLRSASAFSNDSGVDGVIITASTQSDEPVRQAAKICRKRGRIVLVGVTGLNLDRSLFYEKELSFQVSCSYGPGRYDPEYEERGADYPYGFVRWTEQRNFEAALELLATRKLAVQPLISHRFKFEEAVSAYELLAGPEPSLGIVLTYDSDRVSRSDLIGKTVKLSQKTAKVPDSKATKNVGQVEPVVGVIGAGNYGLRTFLPALNATGAKLKILSTSTGVSGAYAGKKFGFAYATTDTASLFTDPEINSIFVLTRHNTHADLVCQALKAGKNVYVEKPLAIFPEQVNTIEATYLSSQEYENPPIVMIGFNRRFAPHMQKIRELIKGIKQPISIIMTINAGEVPSGDWTQDPTVGGGRIIGEGCHFVDLLYYLTGSRPTSVCSTKIGAAPGVFVTDDKMTFTIKFENGSFGTVHYFANGAKSFPKERIEIFCEGRILQLDNFQSLTGFDWPGFRKISLWKQDKGHKESITRFLNAVRTQTGSPIPFEEIVDITNTTFDVVRAASNE
ncbi:MAG: bi-domain-containing oxidoreductase [Deltaproteobacteria bacterium]|nr:bi-domain-containing oxidoreductase [Deltaproteobacteria bacterium]